MAQTKKHLNKAAQIAAEIATLKRICPSGSLIRQTNDYLEWETTIRPTQISINYLVSIKYRIGDVPKIYIVDPNPLPKYPGKSHLPHVYSTQQQRICLYYPGIGEWNADKLIAKSILPWISEWLFFYELWLSIGVWLGEGIHPKQNEKKKEK